MEMAHMSSATLGADITVTSTNSPPVYNPTKVPLNSPKAPANNNVYQQSHGAEDKFELRTFNNLPERKPVDIQFKDISYCVKAGFRKGEVQYTRVSLSSIRWNYEPL